MVKKKVGKGGGESFCNKNSDEGGVIVNSNLLHDRVNKKVQMITIVISLRAKK